jgi:hypothetical protein
LPLAPMTIHPLHFDHFATIFVVRQTDTGWGASLPHEGTG